MDDTKALTVVLVSFFAGVVLFTATLTGGITAYSNHKLDIERTMSPEAICVLEHTPTQCGVLFGK